MKSGAEGATISHEHPRDSAIVCEVSRMCGREATRGSEFEPRMAGTQRRCDGTKLRVNHDPAIKAASRFHRPTSKSIFPLPSTRGTGRIAGSKKRKRRDPRSISMKTTQKSERSHALNPYRPSRDVLAHVPRRPSGASDGGRSLIK